MFKFYSSEVSFSDKIEHGVQRVQFIMPCIPVLIKRKTYAVYKMPGCSEIMVSPNEDFNRMLGAIEADIAKLCEKISVTHDSDELKDLKNEKYNLDLQYQFLMTNKYDFIYRGVGYDTPVCVPALFLEEVGVGEVDRNVYIAYNMETGEIIIHNKEDRWKYDSSEEEEYRERRASSIFVKKFVG